MNLWGRACEQNLPTYLCTWCGQHLKQKHLGQPTICAVENSPYYSGAWVTSGARTCGSWQEYDDSPVASSIIQWSRHRGFSQKVRVNHAMNVPTHWSESNFTHPTPLCAWRYVERIREAVLGDLKILLHQAIELDFGWLFGSNHVRLRVSCKGL